MRPTSCSRVLPAGDHALWSTALFAGLRRGELMALDVDITCSTPTASPAAPGSLRVTTTTPSRRSTGTTLTPGVGLLAVCNTRNSHDPTPRCGLHRGVANSLEVYGARRRLAEAPATLPDAYDFIASFQYGHIRPAPGQVRSEMLALLMIIGSPGSIVELGTARGGTLFLFTRVATPNATIVTVDVRNGPFGGGYPLSHTPLLRSFARDQQTVRLIRGDSRAPNTLRRVREASASPVDFLFIDADHTYKGVKSDYEMYAPW